MKVKVRMGRLLRLCSSRQRPLVTLLIGAIILVSFHLLNNAMLRSDNISMLRILPRQDVVHETQMFDVHNHHTGEVFDLFNYTNMEDCTVLNFLRRPDKSIDSLDRKLFCDEKAKTSDVMCRWFYSQNGISEGADNACARRESDFKVPKIVYYVIFGPYTFQFWHYVSVVAAKRFINPSGIYVIGDAHPVGEWWKQVLRDVSGVRFIYRERPPSISGLQVMWNHHISDLVRLQVIYANGGIYLDTDMVVTRPLDPLLDYDITMGLIENGTGMGNAIILAKRGSKFVHQWYNEYNNYKNKEFYKNSLHVPRDMWHKNPWSIHMESDRFYRPNWFEADKLFKRNDYPWHGNYAIHVWTNKNPVPRGFEDINRLNTTIGQIFRNILYGSPDFKLDG